jgi:hypothetical protein
MTKGLSLQTLKSLKTPIGAMTFVLFGTIMGLIIYILELKKIVRHHSNPGHNHSSYKQFVHIGDAYCLDDAVNCPQVVGIYGKQSSDAKFLYFASKPGTSQQLGFTVIDSKQQCSPESPCDELKDLHGSTLNISGNEYIFRSNPFIKK